MKAPRALAVCLASLLACLAPCAVGAGPGASQALGDLSIEELMNASITSVAKRPQRLGRAAAAVTVLTHDDLRRSGATTLVDALRLVPGLEVAAVDSRQTAVSARGFGGLYSSKLLVLVDGRAVYTPVFSGVFWEMQQILLEDVDRIEVIRGPGATLWGANAVNGVINVVTRSASDTQGEWTEIGGGDLRRAGAGVRDGGRLGEHGHYRIFGGHERRADFPTASGPDNDDSWQSSHAGFRVDADPHPQDHWTWQAGAARSQTDNGVVEGRAANALGQWIRRMGERSSFDVKVFADFLGRNDRTIVNFHTTTLDIEAQHTLAIGTRHEVVWGVGHRRYRSGFEQTNPAALIVYDPDSRLDVYSAFVQDEVLVVPERLTVTGGVKLEHNDFTGWEVQPSLRAAVGLAKGQIWWASLSRAVRSPNIVEAGGNLGYVAGAPFQGPGGAFYQPVISSDPGVRAEVLVAAESGYRAELAGRATADLALFYHDYTRLLAAGDVERFESGTPVGTAVIPWANRFDGETWGGELAVTMALCPQVRVSGSWALLHSNFPDAASDYANGKSPRSTAGLRVSWDVLEATSVDVQLRHVGGIQSVPAYTAAGLNLSWRPGHGLEFSLLGQNLLDPRHPEQPSAPFALAAEVPRSIHARVGWRF